LKSNLCQPTRKHTHYVKEALLQAKDYRKHNATILSLSIKMWNPDFLVITNNSTGYVFQRKNSHGVQYLEPFMHEPRRWSRLPWATFRIPLGWLGYRKSSTTGFWHDVAMSISGSIMPLLGDCCLIIHGYHWRTSTTYQ
jgi:hypothetical protein